MLPSAVGATPVDRMLAWWRRHAPRVAVLGAVIMLCSGCSLFSHGSSGSGSSESVLDVKAGQCFNSPAEVKAELTDVTAVPCSQPHNQEAYATTNYQPPAGADGSVYPGDVALDAFAKGACAQAFSGYVGISYLDSSLYFTYLLPSARSWASEDRSVICFATTTGAPLTVSVKGAKI